MTLRELLSTLKTANVQAVVKDLQDNEVCRISASSVDALDDAVEARVINRWQITGATSLNVVINDPVETTDPSNNPSNDPSDPGTDP